MNMLTFDSILTEAERQTGLAEFTTDTWREGLETLLNDLSDRPCLTDSGIAWLSNILVSALVSRLQVDDYHRRHPDLAASPVTRPVFILGMPRTGTTMASYLMAADPHRRAFLKWEAYNIVPPAAPGALRSDPRCLAELAKDVEHLKRDPGLAARHFEAADGPTEDVHLMAQDFRSLMLDAVCTAPTYRDWILLCDATPAFEHRKRVYQILQSTNPGAWVLKMPSDALFVRELFRVFPDAKVIWTHRDPFVSVSSSFGLRSHGRTNFLGDPNLEYMREAYPRQLAFHASRPLAVSLERPEDFFHLYYNDMIADPMSQMRKIYTWLGDELTPEAEEGMTTWIKENPQGRFGAHSHSLEKWGLQRERLEPYFGDYLRAHPDVLNAA